GAVVAKEKRPISVAARSEVVGYRVESVGTEEGHALFTALACYDGALCPTITHIVAVEGSCFFTPDCAGEQGMYQRPVAQQSQPLLVGGKVKGFLFGGLFLSSIEPAWDLVG